MDEQTTGQPTSDPNPNPGSSSSSAAAAAPGEEALRRLAQRLLSPRYVFQPGPVSDPQLLVGHLPDPLPFAVPLPPQSRIVGSLVQGDAATIVLDCDLPPEQALTFVREQMEAAGWSVPELHHPPQGGFAFGNVQQTSYIQLCRADRTAGLRVAVYAPEGQPTDVRLELETYEDPRHSPCAPQMQRHRDVLAVLPVLLAPVGGSQRPEGGGGGGDSVHSNASLRTELELDAVIAHYQQRLTRANWANTAGGTAGPVGWSTWTFNDEESQPWRALLFIQQEHDAPQQYFLLVRAARVRDEHGGGSGLRYVSEVSFGHVALRPG